MTEYEFHPETKCADSLGNPCDRETIGLLQRRHIKVYAIKCIGKESNNIENVGSGQEHSASNIYTEYADPKRSEWITKIQPALKKAKLKVLEKMYAGQLSRRELIELRGARRKPHRKNQELLAAILEKLKPI